MEIANISVFEYLQKWAKFSVLLNGAWIMHLLFL